MFIEVRDHVKSCVSNGVLVQLPEITFIKCFFTSDVITVMLKFMQCIL